MPISVAEYAPPADPVEMALAYPFDRPEGSFMTDGQEVTALPGAYDEFWATADNYLASHNLPGMAERVPVVAYGANSNPARLAKKMSAFDVGERPALQTAPHITAVIPDTIVAWHGKPDQAGSVFAELYSSPETVGQESQVHLAFLTPQQIALLHATEGITYHLTPIKAQAGNTRQEINAVAYLAGKSEILLYNGAPVKVGRPSDKDTHALTAEEAVDYMLAQAGDATTINTARELVRANAGVNLTEKKKRQAAVSGQLGKLGLSKAFSFPGAADIYIGRADFNSLQAPHDLLHLAEQVVAPLRPSSQALEARAFELAQTQGLDPEAAMEKARKQLDIAEAIRKRAHEELAQRVATK